MYSTRFHPGMTKKQWAGFPWWLSGKESPHNARDMGLISDP